MSIVKSILQKFGYNQNVGVTISPSNEKEITTTEKLLTATDARGGWTAIIHPGSGDIYSIFRPEALSREDQAKAFRDLFYDAIHFIADNVAQSKYRIVDAEGEELENHPFYDVMQNPFKTLDTNGITDKDLLYTMAADLLLFGNSLWLINSLSPSLRQIIPLDPVHVYAVPGGRMEGAPKRLIDHYEFKRMAGAPIKYDPDEIVHVQYVDPSAGDFRFIWGKSPIAAHATLVKRYDQQADLAQDAYSKSGLPTVLAEVDGDATGDTSETALQRIREAIENKFFNRKEKVAVVNAKLMKITTLESKLDQLQFTDVRESTIREIASMFRIDPMFLGLTQTTNRAQADAAIYVFKRFTLKPMLTKIAAQLNADLLQPAYGDNTFIEFYDVVDEDQDVMRANMDMGFRNGAVTPNEIRQILLKLDPIDTPAMNETYLGFSLAPIGSAMAGLPQQPQQAEPVVEIEDDEETITVEDDDDEDDSDKGYIDLTIITDEADKTIAAVTHGEKNRTDRVTLARQRQQWLRLYALVARRSEPDYTSTMRGFFESQIDGVDKRLREWGNRGYNGGSIVKAKGDYERILDFIMFDIDKSTTASMTVMKQPIEQLLLRTAWAQITAMDLPIDTVADDVLQLLDTGGRPEGVFKFAKEINQTTDVALRETLTEGLREGETIAKLSDRIAAVKADAVGFRAVRIARTEINGGYNRAAVETVKSTVDEVGGTPVKFWYTAGPAERDTHNANEMEAQAAGGLPLDQAYAANGLQHPGDPAGDAEEVINCRCVAGHIIEGLVGPFPIPQPITTR